MSNFNLSGFIKQRADLLNINISDLAKKTNISRQTLHNLLNGSTGQLKISTLTSLAKSLQIDSLVLFQLVEHRENFPVIPKKLTQHQLDTGYVIENMTIPDNTLVLINQVFTKIWVIKNVGPIHWIGRKMECMDLVVEVPSLATHVPKPALRSGLIPIRRTIDIPATFSGDSVILQMDFTAPSYSCSVMSYWCMTNHHDELCFPELEGLSCVVQVRTTLPRNLSENRFF